METSLAKRSNWAVLLILLLSSALIFQSAAFAKVKEAPDGIKPLAKPSARPDKQAEVHNVGTLWNVVTNFGQYGDPNSTSPSMEWPGGSDAFYLWEGRYWVGGVVGGEKLVSHADYGNYEWFPKEGSAFFFGPGKSIQDHYVEYDDLYGIAGHIPMGIEVHERSLAWSMSDYDDFIAYEYELINVGENVINDFFISWCYDADVCQNADPSDPHIDDLVDFDGWDGPESDKDIIDWVDPLDLDGDGLKGYDEWGWPYAYPLTKSGVPSNPNYDPDKAEPDGFYDAYHVMIDKRGPALRWQTDVPELKRIAGEIAVVDGDTLKGFIMPRGMSIIYDGDHAQTPEDDIGERGSTQNNAGFIAGRVLYSDIVRDETYLIDGKFGYRTTSEDTFFRPYSHQWWNWESDPGNDIEKYDYMSAQHSASWQMGEHYYFLPHPFDVSAPVFDYRFLLATGPFKTVLPLDTIRCVMVGAVGMGIEGARLNTDNAMKAYYEGSSGDPYHPKAWTDGPHWILPIPPAIPYLVYSPSDGGPFIDLSWDDLAETTADLMLGYIDFEGYKVYRSMYNASSWKMVAAFDNRDEAVLVKDADGNIINAKIDPATSDTVAYDDPNYGDIEGEYVLVNLPPIQHTFSDKGGKFLNATVDCPIYGLKYYYTVVAYDPDKPDLFMISQESAKSNYKKNASSGAPEPVIPRYPLDNDMDKIRVVPNPYKGTALFESRYEDKIMFTNIPPASKISIFTLAGDLVDTIYHEDGYGDVLFDLVSRNTQKVVSGLYIYVVETEKPTYKKVMGKFVIIR
ncbi:hypothetical protein JXJ21_10255 [candidate division KSB1 bacterium]|nr:hypothetical protein [candidate division KSB1 bacterium]